MTPQEYFELNGLFDLNVLKEFAQLHSVYVIQSPRYPDLAMLHYMDECQYDNKWDVFSRMSRGMIVDLKTKKIIAHPFNKFFNLGQMPETQFEALQWKGHFTVTEKLDGSMLILFRDPTSGENRMTTKGSFDSEHGLFATSILPETLKDSKWTSQGTFIFELIEKKYQIVIDYTKKGYPSGLYLIGYRGLDGRLATYPELVAIAKEMGVYVPREYAFLSLDALVKSAETLSVLDEGYVLRYKDDFLVKVKGTEYIRVHRFISKLSDRNLIESLKTGDADLLIELAPEEYREDIKTKISLYRDEAAKITLECKRLFVTAPKATRKIFAAWVLGTNPTDLIDKDLRPAMFNLYDEKPIANSWVFDLVGKRLQVSSETKI
jgi:RNA ligase